MLTKAIDLSDLAVPELEDVLVQDDNTPVFNKVVKKVSKKRLANIIEGWPSDKEADTPSEPEFTEPSPPVEPSPEPAEEEAAEPEPVPAEAAA